MKQWNSFLMGVPVLLALVATTAVAQGGMVDGCTTPRAR